MVKQRFSSADVAAEAACLRQRCLGMRVANVYDINPKTYVLKLARSGEDSDKVLLLVESGVRFHTIEAMPEKADTPSNFTLKLRKHIRTRRLESVKQLGVDRIVQLTFGSGPAACHLLLEFYAQGNVILADDKFEVLTLLRSHRDDAKNIAIMARHPYPIHTIRLRQPLGAAALEGALAGAAPEATLKGVLADLLPYGPLIAEHCALSSGFEPSRQPAAAPLSADEQAALLGGVRQWEAWLDACEDSDTPPQGFIFTKPAPGGKPAAGKGAAGEGAAAAAGGGAPASEGKDAADKAAADKAAAAVYEQFEPLLMRQHAHKPALEFPTFDAAVAEFFGKIAGQRASQAQAQREKAAVGKLEAIRKDHDKRLGNLGHEAEAAELKAALIEYNLEAVDAALNAVREAVASGMDWADLARMIKAERRAGNPVAGLIDSLQLERSRVTLLLSNWLDSEEGDEEAATRPATKVEVDLGLSAHANARSYYDSRRKHQTKQQKTLDANQRALKAAEKKAQQALKQVRSSAAVVITRKPFWFERFHWFISSENFLVLSGRDAQQNELLVKRYLRKGDVYVHADLHGASTTIVRNHTPHTPIPPLTLSQAGQACVCRSQAWDAKVVTSAWWVHPEQVSKTAPTGEYLVTGSFVIRGRKNFLPPQPLVMGYGFMFGLAEESIPGHVGERAPRVREGDQLLPAAGPEEGEGSEDEATLQEQGSGASAPAPTALEAFLDASADTLAGSGGGGMAAPAVRRGSSSGAGGLTGAGADALTAAFARYGLADTLAAGTAGAAAEAADEEDEAGGGGGEGGAGRRHLSAKERQLIKKQQQGKAGGGGAPPQQQQQAQQGSVGGGKKAAAVAGQQQQPQGGKAGGVPALPALKAGGGGKGKKAKGGKYADQDEEDRQLAAQLLQSAGQKKDRKQRKEERKARVAARKAERTGLPKQEITAEDIAKLTARPATAGEDGEEGEEGSRGSSGSEAGDAPQQTQQDQQQEQAQQAQHEEQPQQEAEEQQAQQQQQEAAAEGAAEGAAGSGDESGDEGGAPDADAAPADDAAEVAALLKEENVEALADEERDKLTQLDSLTGVPRGEDILLFAVPVCAPYQVMTGYKYKVKLIPGTLKKGKAVRQAAELLLKGGEVTQRERDLVRAVPEPEALQTLCGTVKIQSAGLLKMKQASKKGKK
ncbi:nuclear export mediator factor Nemf-like isoform X1 [Micractinium conductrix]|uniref:Nuclear export mediator factor Nemf-like isoform X1 n=1 Tax=Micractinium conductrix TaxID=554055 RepID=A0A2P6VMN1_9CHLO|nr:nuclear export mediator factor Nemf-like isoform X1 [Micractinium conductrix]|eukprot:PSC75362.1 nuclear export mediator factor Nemf-like isoform X1 [Micractinium conductrix]